MEATKSEIAFNWIVRNKLDNNKNQIFYSFWSDYLLLTFNKLKKIYDIKAISRALGSDLNGFIKDDDFVPFKDNKFKSMDKIVLLNDYQKDKFQKYSFDDQLKIAPLGVFPQKKNFNEKVDLNEPITFISCGNLIEIKNNFLMIDFLNKFSHQTNKKVKFIMIGDGTLKDKILNKIKNLNNIIFEYHKHVENFVDFLNQNKIHFFLNFSSQEGMPFTIMESMSCGIPAIVSNIPPNKYLVNKNGFIFDLNDFTNSISFTISEVNQCVENKDKYLLKSKKSFDFINENLINSNCFEKFKVILNKL
jgi:glycosyltransferase involved in cell wall biosynthesis